VNLANRFRASSRPRPVCAVVVNSAAPITASGANARPRIYFCLHTGGCTPQFRPCKHPQDGSLTLSQIEIP
jgi:hypothetical protein